jgi:RNA polymerase sigma-70 factor (ECF subfamily)
LTLFRTGDMKIDMQVDAIQLEAHRAPLTGHCYRMLGSACDAEDAVQETMVRAWQGIARFEGRSSLRTWLYRIATNVCLDTLSDRSRRARPMEEGPNGSVEDYLETRERTHWLEPVPDARVLPSDASPFELTAIRQSIRLAFVAALQHLPPRQRAALLLSEVVGWSAAEVAECLGMSVAAVNSALQRARATIATRNGHETSTAPLSEDQSRLLDRYVNAFHDYDVDALVALLRQDATLSMPPYTLWLRGPETIRTWLLGRGAGCRGSRLLPTSASGAPSFGQYRPAPGGGHTPWALIVLELEGDRIAGWNSFLDTEKLFPLFGLPSRLPA